MTTNRPTATDFVQTPPTSTEGFNSLSVPTYRASTITYPNVDSFIARGSRGRHAYSYGLAGTPTSRTLADKLTALENGCDTFLTPSGLMAITVSCLAVLSAGDRVLLPETVYAPVRRFAADTLAKLNIEAHYYDPTKPVDLGAFGPELRLLWIESPGSITMEMQDIAALSKQAKDQGILVGCDNSWATPFYCRPLDLGADIVVEAVTKYLAGHSDLLLGSTTVRTNDLAGRIHAAIRALGVGVSPDDCFLALRGLETAHVRLTHVGRTALSLAEKLLQHENVTDVLMPALPSGSGHALWKQQYSGTCGVFSFVMLPDDEESYRARFARLQLMQIGASWGGTHSLIAPSPVADGRCGGRYDGKRINRLSVGLEDAKEIGADLDRFLDG